MREHRSDWDDLSNYVVHFTKETTGSADQLIAILLSGVIEARNRYGIAYKNDRAPRVVCLTETPIHKLGRIIERRGPYGIGFHKRFAVQLGGGPVMYAYGPQITAAQRLIAEAADDSPAWQLSAFIDPVSKRYAFDWEREWRVPSDIKFTADEFDFLVMPETEHAGFLEWAHEEIQKERMPQYAAPLIDASWSKERIKETLNGN